MGEAAGGRGKEGVSTSLPALGRGKQGYAPGCLPSRGLGSSLVHPRIGLPGPVAGEATLEPGSLASPPHPRPQPLGPFPGAKSY